MDKPEAEIFYVFSFLQTLENGKKNEQGFPSPRVIFSRKYAKCTSFVSTVTYKAAGMYRVASKEVLDFR